MGSCNCAETYEKYEKKIGNVFGKYGGFVSKYPWILLIISIIVNCGFGLGLIRIDSENDIEALYTPIGSQASKDRATLKKLYPDQTGNNFHSKGQTDISLFADVIFKTKDNSNILKTEVLREISVLDSTIRSSFTVKNSSGYDLSFTDVCALQNGQCVVNGDFLLEQKFANDFQLGQVSFPLYNQNSLNSMLGDVTSRNGVLVSASMIRIIYFLRQDTPERKSLSLKWEKEFVSKMPSIQGNFTDTVYSTSDSLNTELDSNTLGDIKYFALTFTLMITYASVAALGGNCVSDRQNLGRAGVLGAVLSILGSFGFVSLCGVKFVNIVGVMPFLIIGIGIDDVFILMSGMSDSVDQDSISRRMANALKGSGVAITITSLTDLLSFVIGASSVFRSVRNFCIYTGVAVVFCYFNQLTFFVPCMVINERRVEDNRHCGSCKKVKDKDTLEKEGKSKCFICCCSGNPPRSRSDVESPLEKYPKILFKKIVSFTVCKVIIVILFLVYIGISIWGVLNLKQGLDLGNLVSDDSYLHRYSSVYNNNFKNEIIVTFAVTSKESYSNSHTQNLYLRIMENAKQDADINDNFDSNWILDYKNSSFYDHTSETKFIAGLKQFLSFRPDYRNDVVFDKAGSAIISSRFYVLSGDLHSSSDQGDFMLRMRKIADNSELSCTAFAPAFIFYEQYVVILKSTLQTMAVAVAVMVVVTLIFMPHPILVVLVFMTMVMILLGIFGFMHFWDLTLSSVTMIHLIMSIGFSVDFSAHICHAYISGDESTRQNKVSGAIDRAGGPIFNAAVSSFIGIIMLVFSSSYIFFSFFKVMFLVIVFGVAHSLFLLPVILSVIGPLKKPSDVKATKETLDSHEMPSLKRY